MNDSAEFSCLAENSFGRANATIVLIVEVSIEINDIPIKETVSRANFLFSFVNLRIYCKNPNELLCFLTYNYLNINVKFIHD